MKEINFDPSMTPEQKEEATQFLTILCMGRLDVHVIPWLNSGRMITYEQIQTLMKCQNASMLEPILDAYSKGATVTFFKTVYKQKEDKVTVPRPL